MPRPSDLYANLGAPGVYQATPVNWIPYQLPCVYVFPPEEENQKVLCVFHAGSASPASYKSFYDVPDEDPFSSEHIEFERGVRKRNAKVAYRAHDWRMPKQGASISRASNSSISSSLTTSSPDSMLDQPDEATDQSFDRHPSGYLEDWQETHVAVRPASRRSSVFGDRPSDHEVPEMGGLGEQSHSMICRRQTLSVSIKNKAATVFKAMTGSRAKLIKLDSRHAENAVEQATESDLHPEHERWFEPEPSLPQQKKSRRRALAQLFISKSSTRSTSKLPPTEDVNLVHLTPTTINNNIVNKRKSVTSLLRFHQDKPVAVGSDKATDVTPITPALSKSFVLPEDGRRTSKYKSISHMWRIGGNLSRPPPTTSTTDITNQDIPQSQSNDSPLTVLPDTIIHPTPQPLPPGLHRSGSPVSFASEASTARLAKRRISFLNGRSFSFRRHQRHVTLIQQTPNIPPNNITTVERETCDFAEMSCKGQRSPPVSTDSETGEDEPQSPILVDMPTLVIDEDLVEDQVMPDVAPKLRSADIQEDLDFATRFELRVENGVRTTDLPIMELAVQLNSLDFDRLALDADTFTNPTCDN